VVAAECAKLKDGQKKVAAPIGAATTQSEAAKKFNVGRTSVQRARKVIDKGAPVLEAAIESGKMAVSEAAGIADLPIY
jgi:hypothetical protein